MFVTTESLPTETVRIARPPSTDFAPGEAPLKCCLSQMHFSEISCISFKVLTLFRELIFLNRARTAFRLRPERHFPTSATVLPCCCTYLTPFTSGTLQKRLFAVELGMSRSRVFLVDSGRSALMSTNKFTFRTVLRSFAGRAVTRSGCTWLKRPRPAVRRDMRRAGRRSRESLFDFMMCEPDICAPHRHPSYNPHLF